MAKKKASDAIKQGAGPGRVRAMVQMGLYEDDCGVLDDAPPLPDLLRPASAKPALPVPDNVVRLPVWPDEARGVPNVALRSALFGAIRRGPRRYLKSERMASVDGMEVLYTGEQLDQGDLDVWEAVLHFIRKQELGKECRFTAYVILRMLGKADNGQNREILHKRLLRLRANAVEVRSGRFTYIGGLIDDVFKDEKTHEYVVVANPRIKVLFERDQFTLIDWAVRLELVGHPLGQWLHGFYTSHAKPYAYSVEKLHELCGSENHDLRGFKRDLREALDLVATASEKHGQAFSGKIEDGLVVVDRQPSKSQRKHLAGKAKKPERRNGMAPVGDILKPKQK
jgi:TrfA protein